MRASWRRTPDSQRRSARCGLHFATLPKPIPGGANADEFATLAAAAHCALRDMGIAVLSDPGSVKNLEEAPERVVGCSCIRQAPKEGPGSYCRASSFTTARPRCQRQCGRRAAKESVNPRRLTRSPRRRVEAASRAGEGSLFLCLVNDRPRSTLKRVVREHS